MINIKRNNIILHVTKTSQSAKKQNQVVKQSIAILLENAIMSLTSFLSQGTHAGLSLTSAVISCSSSLNPRLSQKHTTHMEILLPVTKSNLKDADIDMQLLSGHEVRNKLPPTHGVIFCRLTVSRQEQQELRFRPYSQGLYHIDGLLFGCQRMDQIQKLKPSWHSFIFSFL